MIKRIKNQRATSVLGLSFDGNKLDAVVFRRTNGSVQPVASTSAVLALDLLSGDPELVAREIRNHLQAAEIRERRCVVCLPLSWVFTLQTKAPNLSDSDLINFLDIEAERGFPQSLDALVVSRSDGLRLGEDNIVLQTAVPRSHMVRLEQVLRAAKLTPLSFSVALPSLQSPRCDKEATIVSLGIGETNVGLQVTSMGALVVLRSLDHALEIEGVEKRIYADVIGREMRITFGQTAPRIREKVQTVRVFGPEVLAERLISEIRPRLQQMGFASESVTRFKEEQFGIHIPTDVVLNPAGAMAVRHLAGQAPLLEFLPPRLTAWQQIANRYSSRKLAYPGIAAGAIALAVVIAFTVQQVQLVRLRSQWAAISPKARELDQLQHQIRQYRPWFDESFRSLSILKKLTEAFPEDGSVTAKSIEMRESAPIICSGTARDNQALMKTIDKLNAASEVADLQYDQVRGKSPIQFTFNFQWGEKSQQ